MSGEAIITEISIIIKLVDAINGISLRITAGRVTAFEPVTVPQPNPVSSHHGFFTCISWLYVLYNECSGPSLTLLCKQAVALHPDASRLISSHPQIVHAFRTCFQHKINIAQRDDAAKHDMCQRWIDQRLERTTTFTPLTWPEQSSEWTILLAALARDARTFLEYIHSTLVETEQDEAVIEFTEVWVSRVSRVHPAHIWDSIVSSAIVDLGHDTLSPVKIRKKYLSQWSAQLNYLPDGYDFYREGRRLVEHTLLNEVDLPLPFDGTDIMRELHIKQGPELALALNWAKSMYKERPDTRKNLLEIFCAEWKERQENQKRKTET